MRPTDDRPHDRPRLGLTLSAIDNTLYDAFGQRQVSTIYNALNQYHVVMEVAPRYWQNPETLQATSGSSTSGANPSGVQQTNAVGRRFRGSSRDGGQRTAATIAADSARNLAINSLAASGHSSASAGAAVATARRRWFRWRRSPVSRSAQTPLVGQSPGPVRRLHDLVQSRARPCAQRGAEGDRRGDRRHRHAFDHPRRVRRHGGDLSSNRWRASRC